MEDGNGNNGYSENLVSIWKNNITEWHMNKC
jgi:hypothetical protein